MGAQRRLAGKGLQAQDALPAEVGGRQLREHGEKARKLEGLGAGGGEQGGRLGGVHQRQFIFSTTVRPLRFGEQLLRWRRRWATLEA